MIREACDPFHGKSASARTETGQLVGARLSPEGVLGLHLTLGASALLVMAWTFGSIAEDVVTRDPTVLLDLRVSEWFQQHGTATFFWMMAVITLFGSGVWILCATAFGAALLIWRRAWYRLFVLIVVVLGGEVFNVALKAAFQRERPQWEHPLVVLHSYSFPSGHTMGATVLYGLAAVWGVSRVHAVRGRVGIVAAASCGIFSVGLSRVALGAHFLSDVLGAVAAGLAWLALCVTSVETWRRRRHSKVQQMSNAPR